MMRKEDLDALRSHKRKKANVRIHIPLSLQDFGVGKDGWGGYSLYATRHGHASMSASLRRFECSAWLSHASPPIPNSQLIYVVS